MKNVRIECRRGIFCKKVTADIPEEYSEMSARQFHAIVEVGRKKISEEKFVEQFFGIKARLWASLDKFYIYKMTELIRDLKEGHSVSFFFDKSIKVGGKTFLAPDDMLQEMTLQQFMTIDTFFSWYIYNEKVENLYKFMAACFLPEKGDFFSMNFDKAVSFFADHEEARETYEAELVNWMLIKNWLSHSYRYMFPEPDVNNLPKGKKQRPESWMTFFDALIGENLANIDAYSRLKCLDVFRITNNRIKEQRKMKKK